MTNLFDMLGGRKMTLALLALVFVGLYALIYGNENTLELVVWIAIGGAGSIAIDDGLTKFRSSRVHVATVWPTTTTSPPNPMTFVSTTQPPQKSPTP